ncbi:type II toxin-antitoxin system VapC family toxin [Propioniciclava tarda]|uniref:PIN domain-containing protein n=1 Tax=Propioniciclava tarda TaxID=433330 RepID=A0A4Q9KNS0_PROTD|nr:PIN domain-containing protein [Propioniciclava tarda]TBT96213.1 PIN domain-containing protein [Propioniciclava tarda]SMO33512.1 Predicted nucleic acid-binding protein, contains PIN domain [Propioniciclava tarda]HOA88536.1 PIN domain-containing protein [Propioniciclava tarda]HQA30142.1 PIN domain-containing protein [Propioniciclava tarda]HQD60507.1 PIN domain-containing protein [Propioniciclava tarda]
MDAFDADVLIYAAAEGHELGSRVLPLLLTDEVRVGSTMLLPELLAKPLRDGQEDEVIALGELLGTLSLLPCTETVGELAAVLAAQYGLRPMDAVHLATAVDAGADRFITNNSRDFDSRIVEIDVVRPGQL